MNMLKGILVKEAQVSRCTHWHSRSSRSVGSYLQLRAGVIQAGDYILLSYIYPDSQILQK